MKLADQFAAHEFALDVALTNVEENLRWWLATRRPVNLMGAARWLRTARTNLAACERLTRRAKR